MKLRSVIILGLVLFAARAEADDGARYIALFDSSSDAADAGSLAENELIRAMLKKGAVFVDEAQSRKARASLSAKELVGGNIPESITAHDADLIIAAVVRAHRDEAGALLSDQLKVARYQATVEAKLIAVDTGEVLDSVVLRGIGMETNAVRASQLALQNAGKVLAEHLLSGTHHRSRRVEIFVTDLPLAGAERLRFALLDMPGAKTAKVVSATPALTKVSMLLDATAPSGQALADAIDQSAEAGLIVTGFSDRAVQARYSAERAVRIPVVFGQFSGGRGKTGAQLSTFVGRALLDAGYLSALEEKAVDLGDNTKQQEKQLAKLGMLERDAIFLRGEYFDRGRFLDLDVELRSTRPGLELYVRDRATCPKDQLMSCTGGVAKNLLEKLPAALVAKRTVGTARASESLAVEKMIVDPDLFPVLGEYYRQRGIGRVVVQNRSASPAKRGTIRVSLAGVSKEALVRELPDIAPGAKVEMVVPLAVDGEPKPAASAELVVEIAYELAGRRERLRRNTSIAVLPRYALDWRTPDAVAAFVTTKSEPQLRALADAALASIPAAQQGEPIARAVALFHALSGVDYQKDAVHPGRSEEIDDVQLPFETLARRRGDCEDLTTLYAALVEASGARAIFILTPGHVLAGIDTELPEQARTKISLDPDRVLIHRGRVYLPIETTRAGDNFDDAWADGAKLVARSKKEGLELSIVDVREAWERYPASSFAGKGSLAYNTSFAGVEKEIARLVKARKSEIDHALSSVAIDKLDAAQLANHATLLAMHGRVERAREVLTTGVLRFSKTPALTNNLANVELMRSEIDAALVLYEKALANTAAVEGVVRIHLNSAIAARMHSDHGLSHEHIAKALDRAGSSAPAQKIVHDFLASLGGAGIVQGERAATDKKALALQVRDALEKRSQVRADGASRGVQIAVTDIVYWLDPGSPEARGKK
jgi:hypothetical protein